MTEFEVLVLAIALALDAMLVSFSYGIIMNQRRVYNSLILSSFFGFFQFLMPVIGFYFTGFFISKLEIFSKWIVFTIFIILGIKFLKEALSQKEKNEIQCIGLACIIGLAIATSIDALAVGISLAFFNVSIFGAGTIIGVTTLVLSFLGVILGSLFGEKFKTPAEIFGGTVLVLIGLKILLEHLGILIL